MVGLDGEHPEEAKAIFLRQLFKMNRLVDVQFRISENWDFLFLTD